MNYETKQKLLQTSESVLIHFTRNNAKLKINNLPIVNFQ